MKIWKRIVVVILLCALFVASEAGHFIQADAASKRVVTYSGVKVVLPKSWTRSAVQLKNEGTGMAFISTKNKKDGGYLATLFSCRLSQWKGTKKNLPNFHKIGVKGKKVLYVVEPTDVQCGASKASQRSYTKLQKQAHKIKLA